MNWWLDWLTPAVNEEMIDVKASSSARAKSGASFELCMFHEKPRVVGVALEAMIFCGGGVSVKASVVVEGSTVNGDSTLSAPRDLT